MSELPCAAPIQPDSDAAHSRFRVINSSGNLFLQNEFNHAAVNQRLSVLAGVVQGVRTGAVYEPRNAGGKSIHLLHCLVGKDSSRVTGILSRFESKRGKAISLFAKNRSNASDRVFAALFPSSSLSIISSILHK